MEPESVSPRVLISYTHDSPAHEAKVLALSDRLRREGIDAILDQYEPFPAQGWIQWMKHHVLHSSFILVVCTEIYNRRAAGEEKPGVGLGATYESRLYQQLLYNEGGVNEKCIPVLLTEQDSHHIPIELQSYTHYRLATEGGYEDLYRLLTSQPKTKKPVLGRLRALQPKQPRPDFRNRLWNVPQRNICFTGREPHLQAIHQALTQTKAAAINGIGGMGKTQTAIEYAHRHRADYDSVFWASAAQDVSLLSGFATLAQLLELPEKDEKELSAVAAAVSRWLQSSPGWLLVVDNVDTVDDLNEVHRLVPPGSPGHLLLTTRLQATSRVAKPVELEKMEPEEGALFLLRRAGVIDNNAPLTAAQEPDHKRAERISTEVGGLPLALDQAGAFIDETPSTLDEYLHFYQTEGARLRKQRGDVATDHASVTVTFSLAFNRLEKKNPSAADLLRACAFLAPDAIPEDIFTEGGANLGELLSQLAASPLNLTEAIGDAGRLALLRRNALAKTLNVHRQIQEVLKDEMDPQTRRLWAGRVAQALARVFPSPEFGNWTQCESLLPHARVAARHIEDFGLDSEAASVLLNNAGYYLDDRAEYVEAESLYQRALAISEKAPGPDHPSTATSLNNLALLYVNQGRYELAEPLYQRALAIREKAQGPGHPDTATSLNNLADLHRHQGRNEQAEPLYQRALAIYEIALGPDHPDTATSLNNLALLYNTQGRYEQAELLYQRALAINEKALGPDHPSTATSLNNLAGLHRNQGRYEQAEPLYQRALAIREKELGPDHPNTAVSLNNLAVLHDTKGHYEEAEPVYRRALAIREKVLGPDHPDTASSLNNLAVFYHNQGRYEQAEPLYQRAVAIREKVLGLGHPDTAATITNYAALLQKMGRDAEASALQARLNSSKPQQPDPPS